MTWLVTTTAAAILGCAGGSSAGPPPLMTGATCGTDRVPVQDTTWPEARGDGFTYCVPVTWRAVDGRGRRWRSPQIEFSFAPSGQPRRVPFTVSRTDGTLMPPTPAHAEGSRATVYFLTRQSGRLAQLALDHPEGRSIRGTVSGDRPDVSIESMARTVEAAEEILAAFRSIRFVSEP